MDPRQAKLQTLQDLIGAMDDHMLGPVAAKAKAKQAPQVAGALIGNPGTAPKLADATAPAPESDDLDADTATKLRKMYEEDQVRDVDLLVPMG